MEFGVLILRSLALAPAPADAFHLGLSRGLKEDIPRSMCFAGSCRGTVFFSDSLTDVLAFEQNVGRQASEEVRRDEYVSGRKNTENQDIVAGLSAWWGGVRYGAILVMAMPSRSWSSWSMEDRAEEQDTTGRSAIGV